MKNDIMLPTDAGTHIWANTEWWYCFSFLEGEKGNRYAVMASFFIVGEGTAQNNKGHYLIFSFIDLNKEEVKPYSLIDSKMLFGMFTVYLPIYFTHHPKDEYSKALYTNLLKFKLPSPHKRMGEVKLEVDPTTIFYGDKAIVFKDENKHNFSLYLSAEGTILQLDFQPVKPIALIGLDGKPDTLYYYSFTRNAVSGYILKGEEREQLSGSGWFDHQWGNEYELLIKSGWNWFGIQLEDGRELLINQFKYVQLKNTFSPMANLIDAHGNLTFTREVLIEPLEYWKSIQTNADYPVKWKISIPDFKMHLTVEAILKNQEMPIIGPLHAIWEGACAVTVHEQLLEGEKTIKGKAFMELVGYANYNAQEKF